MKVLRDLSGADLARVLARFRYTVTRQTGSHLRLTTTVNSEHHVAVPAHDLLRVSMLATILAEAAAHHGLTRELGGLTLALNIPRYAATNQRASTERDAILPRWSFVLGGGSLG